VPERRFDLTPLVESRTRFPYFALILTITGAALLLWFSGTGDPFITGDARGPFRLAGLILSTLRGPMVVLAAPLVAAVLTPGLGAVVSPPWQPVIRGARWGGIASLILAGWPLFPALLGSLLFVVASPETPLAAFAAAPGGALRLMIPGIILGGLLARVWTTRHRT
jgi:hypothetical protein